MSLCRRSPWATRRTDGHPCSSASTPIDDLSSWCGLAQLEVTKVKNEAVTLQDYVKTICVNVASGVMRDLQKITDTHSGPDSGLRNAWDEICVQCQSEESFSWDTYDVTVRQCISHRLSKLPREMLKMLWFELDTDSAEDESEYDEDELAHFLAGEFVYPLAEAYSNHRIKKYLWRRD